MTANVGILNGGMALATFAIEHVRKLYIPNLTNQN